MFDCNHYLKTEELPSCWSLPNATCKDKYLRTWVFILEFMSSGDFKKKLFNKRNSLTLGRVYAQNSIRGSMKHTFFPIFLFYYILTTCLSETEWIGFIQMHTCNTTGVRLNNITFCIVWHACNQIDAQASLSCFTSLDIEIYNMNNVFTNSQRHEKCFDPIFLWLLKFYSFPKGNNTLFNHIFEFISKFYCKKHIDLFIIYYRALTISYLHVQWRRELISKLSKQKLTIFLICITPNI